MFGKWNVKALIATGVVIVAIVLWVRLNDPYLEAVEHYIRGDPGLRESIGRIDHLTLRKTTTRYRSSGIGAAKEPGSVKYLFLATGDSGNAAITVTVYISENDEPGRIEIENVER